MRAPPLHRTDTHTTDTGGRLKANIELIEEEVKEEDVNTKKKIMLGQKNIFFAIINCVAANKYYCAKYYKKKRCSICCVASLVANASIYRNCANIIFVLATIWLYKNIYWFFISRLWGKKYGYTRTILVRENMNVLCGVKGVFL